jgi:uncharacterized LabA/DUF88 family protein
MKSKPNYAFIDSQNLNLAIRTLGWKVDMMRFRIYLNEKYHVEKAFLFIGYVPKYEKMYAAFREYGFICIFRPTLTNKDGSTKGNCDAELVLQAMIEYKNYDKAIIVSGDGDFQCLAKYLYEHNKLGVLLIPNQKKYSALLKFDIFKPKLRFISDLRTKLEYIQIKKNPRKDETLEGKSSIGDTPNLSQHKANVNKKTGKKR